MFLVIFILYSYGYFLRDIFDDFVVSYSCYYFVLRLFGWWIGLWFWADLLCFCMFGLVVD